MHSWESIAAECLASASIALQAQEEFNARRAYYSVEVPGYLLTLLDERVRSPPPSIRWWWTRGRITTPGCPPCWVARSYLAGRPFTVRS